MQIILLESHLRADNEWVEEEQVFEVSREMPKTYELTTTYESGLSNSMRIRKNELNRIMARWSRAYWVFITEDQDKRYWKQQMREAVFSRVNRDYQLEKARYEAMTKVMGYVEPSVTAEVEVIQAPEVEMHYSVTNGMPTDETMNGLFAQGYVPLLVAQAKQFHPYANDNGAILFYAKPINKDEMDKFIAEEFPKEISKHDSR